MKKNKHTLLWEISGKELKETSYLFGTMHVRDKKAFRGIEFLQDCILNCDAFAAEFDLQDASHRKFHLAARIPKKKSLEDFLNPRIYKKLDKLVKRETNCPLDDFKYSSPIILFNVLSESQFGKDNNMPLDNSLFKFAEQNEKTLLGLESFQAQINIFSKVDMKEQCRYLKRMTTNFNRFRKELQKSAELYIKGDIQKLVKNAKKSIGSMRKILLYDRNITMAEKFISYASEQRLFAAIGAGHLGGEKGVLRLLKLKGYKIIPIIY
ncbi:MAG: TraB/GumN family protein [Saprospiraceae bacterium]|nr:TraB/GumN family protein [Saprospiraceae bacterium]